MSVHFYDRVFDRTVDTLPEQAVLGRYRFLIDGVASLNSVRLSTGDYLIPDQEGHWALVVEGEQTIAGEFLLNQLESLRATVFLDHHRSDCHVPFLPSAEISMEQELSLRRLQVE